VSEKPAAKGLNYFYFVIKATGGRTASREKFCNSEQLNSYELFALTVQTLKRDV